jgi:hypothetical protein
MVPTHKKNNRDTYTVLEYQLFFRTSVKKLKQALKFHTFISLIPINNNHYLHKHSMHTRNCPDDVNQPFSHDDFPSEHKRA